MTRAPYLSRYPHLDRPSGLPRLVTEGLATYGTREAPGPSNNVTILNWARELGVSVTDMPYTADSIPWCGLWIAVIVQRSNYTPVARPLWALNWGNWGSPSPTPSLGDILTFTRAVIDPRTKKRRSAGHVGIYIAEDDTAYHVLGGNQSDMVNITRIAKSRLYAASRSPWRIAQPASVKPYRVSGTGSLSTNEA